MQDEHRFAFGTFHVHMRGPVVIWKHNNPKAANA